MNFNFGRRTDGQPNLARRVYSPNAFRKKGEAGIERAERKRIVERSQAGDAEAFSTLARAYERRLFMPVLHHTRYRYGAEDLSQEVWLKAFRALKSFRGESGYYRWWRQIVINSFLN